VKGKIAWIEEKVQNKRENSMDRGESAKVRQKVK
jgi:hypothetical protein